MRVGALLKRRSSCREDLPKNAPTLLRGSIFRPLCSRLRHEFGALAFFWLRRRVKPIGALPALVFLVALLVAPLSWGQSDVDVEKCFTAYEQTQIKLKEGKFTEAQKIAAVCSEGCPDEINEQCRGWGRQAEREVPTVLLFARFEDGKDAQGVRVEVDGSPSALRREIALDPGEHTIVFRGRDGWEETLEVTVYQGEKRRPIKATVPKKERPPPLVAEEPRPRNGARNWAIVSFSVGAVGIGVASVATLIALNQKSQLDDCAPGCDPADVNRTKRTLLIADVGAVVGAVGVVSGVAILLWGNPKETKSSRASLELGPLDGGASAIVRGTF